MKHNEKSVWANRYGWTKVTEYWAEAMQSYFGANRYPKGTFMFLVNIKPLGRRQHS